MHQLLLRKSQLISVTKLQKASYYQLKLAMPRMHAVEIDMRGHGWMRLGKILDMV